MSQTHREKRLIRYYGNNVGIIQKRKVAPTLELWEIYRSWSQGVKNFIYGHMVSYVKGLTTNHVRKYPTFTVPSRGDGAATTKRILLIVLLFQLIVCLPLYSQPWGGKQKQKLPIKVVTFSYEIHDFSALRTLCYWVLVSPHSLICRSQLNK